MNGAYQFMCDMIKPSFIPPADIRHLRDLVRYRSKLTRMVTGEKNQAALDLSQTVPGFDKNPMTAIQILSEIGGGMSVFPSAKHLVSWAGCCQRNDQSNKKINQLEFPVLVPI